MATDIAIIHDDSHRAVQALEVAAHLQNKQLPHKVILTCGRDVIDKAFAARGRGDILVSILDPGRDYDKFDLIFVPAHDPHPDMLNIRTTLGIINRINPKNLSEQYYNAHNMPRPILSVLVGGRHVGGNFSEKDAMALAKILNDAEYTTLVTTSKRTEESAAAALKNNLKITNWFFDYNKGPLAANPYLSMLAGSDKIIVTSDSVRMCSEACSSGRQVFIYTPEQTHFSYFSLRDSLFDAGAALDVAELKTTQQTTVLNEAKRVADEIIEYTARL